MGKRLVEFLLAAFIAVMWLLWILEPAWVNHPLLRTTGLGYFQVMAVLFVFVIGLSYFFLKGNFGKETALMVLLPVGKGNLKGRVQSRFRVANTSQVLGLFKLVFILFGLGVALIGGALYIISSTYKGFLLIMLGLLVSAAVFLVDFYLKGKYKDPLEKSNP